MRLNPPTVPVFLISFSLVVAVVSIKYFGADIPVAQEIVSGGLFEVLLVAYGILLAGNLFRGL